MKSAQSHASAVFWFSRNDHSCLSKCGNTESLTSSGRLGGSESNFQSRTENQIDLTIVLSRGHCSHELLHHLLHRRSWDYWRKLCFFELMPCARGSDGHQNVLSLIGYSHMLERWDYWRKLWKDRQRPCKNKFTKKIFFESPVRFISCFESIIIHLSVLYVLIVPLRINCYWPRNNFLLLFLVHVTVCKSCRA